MSQYGSVSNIRDGTVSPSYSSLGKHRDNYNRFETARHADHRQQRLSSQEQEESRFSGFGDRPGSGVELSGFNWNGGEIIDSPTQLPKSIKPRKFYYSPIGDGTVAADGYELKRKPVDLSPRVTVTQLQHVERGERGKDGLNIYEKTWSTGGGGSVPPSEFGYGSEYGLGSGRNSRAGGALSPEPYKPPAAAPPPPANNGYPPKPASDYGAKPYGSSSGGDPFGSSSNLGPKDGRNSVASSLFSDPAYRLDTKTGYLITNPRELINQYATMTPVAVIDENPNHTPATHVTSKQSYYKRSEDTYEEQYAPHAPYKAPHAVQAPNKFVRQLRDETMTHSQREANTHSEPANNKDPNYQQRVSEIRSKTTSYTRGDDIDQLTQQLVSGLRTGHSKYQ